MKMQNFIVAMLLVVLCMFVFVDLMVNISTEYEVLSPASELSAFNKSAELMSKSSNISETMMNATGSGGIVDLVGFYVGQGLATLKFAFGSVGIFNDLTEAAQLKLGLPSYFMTIIITIVLMIIILGIFLRATNGSD